MIIIFSNSIYTRVSYYYSWIVANMATNQSNTYIGTFPSATIKTTTACNSNSSICLNAGISNSKQYYSYFFLQFSFSMLSLNFFIK